ncbi:MAG: hypothetical protein ABEJ60_00870 [Halodesulfurarchaeum sp.]
MNARSPAVLGWLVLLVLSAVAFGAPVAQAADSPNVTVTVNGETVRDGAWIVRPEVNLSLVVRADAPIETVLVRINGKDVLEATPGSSRFETSFEPAALHARWNTIQVVATVEGEGLQTHLVHVYQDSLAPNVGLTSPITVEPGHQFPERIHRTNATLTVKGTVTDAAEITQFTAWIRGSGQSVETTTLQNGSFVLETTLALGNHTLAVVATDEYGNTARQFTRFRVTDEGKPSVTLRGWPNETASRTIRPTVVATDAVAVRSIVVRVSGQPSRRVLDPTAKLLGAGRTNVTRPVTIEFYHPGIHNVTVNVTDYAGRYAKATTAVVYDPVTPAERAVPEIAVEKNQSGIVDGTGYHLEATVSNGSIVQVVVEATANETGRVTAYEQVYDGEPRNRIEISRTLSLDPGRHDVRIEVVDSYGRTHIAGPISVEIDTADESETSAGTVTATESTKAGPRSSTARPTSIPVTKPPPLTPVSGVSASTSPLLVPLAVVLVGVVVLRRN